MTNTILLERQISISQPDESFSPIRICEIEIGKSLPDISALNEQNGQQYQRAHCLIRLHTQSLGLVDLPFESDELSPREYAPVIWQALGEQINAHLREDGLPEVRGLDAAGLPAQQTPKCIEEREAFLKSAPFASVILATRDRPEHLARCLPTLLAQEYPDYEILVVDNAPSTSATADLIQRVYADEPRIRYVREDRPGLPVAHNRGIVEARGEILAFTDDDVVLDRYWLAGLARGFKAAEKVACVTGLILPLELETSAQFFFEAYGGFTRGFSRRICNLREHHWKTPSYPYIAGACSIGAGASMAFTASFLKSEGGFDPVLGPGCPTRGGEDIAAFLQVILQGYSLVYEPSSLLYHQHRQTYRDLEKQLYDYGVGFAAYLTKIIIDHPFLIFDCIIKVIRSLFVLRHNSSPTPENKAVPLPQELKDLQRKGMRQGSLIYARSRWASGWRRKGLALASARGQIGASLDRSQESPAARIKK